MPDSRGQLSLSLVEASIGVLLVLAAASAFAVSVPPPDRENARLDVLAADGIEVLDRSRPSDEGSSLLARLGASRSGFVQEREDASDRLHAALPRRVRYRLETPHGTLGMTPPSDRPVGRTRAFTVHGETTLWVWFA